MQRDEREGSLEAVRLTLAREGQLWSAMCGKTIVFRSLDKANVLHFIALWNSAGDSAPIQRWNTQE